MNTPVKRILLSIRTYGYLKVLKFVFFEAYHFFWQQKIIRSFSQSKEDLIIDKILKRKKSGYYVDIGAHNPTRFNNTQRFYLRGWRGINIEPDPENFKTFKVKRKRDVNLNIGIGRKKSRVNFYKFNPSTLSTFSTQTADNYMQQGFQLVFTKKVVIDRLSAILSRYSKRHIDFMSIDTEGLELDVLQSNNWRKLRPAIICIESHIDDFKRKKRIWNKEIPIYLENVGYKLYCDTGQNSIYVDKKTFQKT